ncbi:hypothetical protein VA7868_00468 [Vibrio aerogenes CECT 7868]|uniref:Uncharacterized protein n=1 Tax=Vibrio aerogenes CECT 7868 TaxID=1216006 RepID=A0A1M5VP22_9VIBR|nr:hypothetical protein [Vibrio aerogenes]SHH76950.1 hypothetical protein VA7868_00468 [Vibrio aerogenes CECT 7868]
MKMTLTFIALSIAAAPVIATQMLQTEAAMMPHQAIPYVPSDTPYSPALNEKIQSPLPTLKQFRGCDDPLNC